MLAYFDEAAGLLRRRQLPPSSAPSETLDEATASAQSDIIFIFRPSKRADADAPVRKPAASCK